ncbi:adenylate/guanylate cyclase catalytic domain protein [Ancylostoma ceylanicum]|uniref:adenylate cyclase n=1 Tax=Ancylostoma ceylanicum TaxID=53326 RepID=A0A0D6LN83_9BILA|nr:adenylate/guanylate cyclase catalytic domain protein [Ancylostoma ceylanicum]
MYEENFEGGREFLRVLNEMVEFALAIQHVLSVFNEDLLNFDFVCKLGLNIGPVTAGVIGTTKLYYDIWGDTVNIASRMYSTGVLNRIQVSAHTREILLDRYEFEYRDHIEVKGIDGGMDTYLLVGRKADRVPPAVTSQPKDEGSTK